MQCFRVQSHQHMAGSVVRCPLQPAVLERPTSEAKMTSSRAAGLRAVSNANAYMCML